MVRKRWIFPAVLTGLAAMIATLPLSWVAPFFVPDEGPELSYHGTIWAGTVSDIPVFDVANIDVNPLSLSADVEAGDGQSYLSANFSRSEAKDVRLIVDLSALPLTDQRLQGLVGTIRASLPNLGYDANGCTSAQGQVSTDLLQRNGGTMNWTGPELSGPITCDGGALVASLSGRDAQQSVQAILRLSPDGTYRADITAQTSRQEAGAVLPLFGFTRRGRDFVLTEQGKWR